MIRWRIAIPVVLAAAVVAGCITYMATPVQPQRIETDQRMQALIVPKAPETIPPPKEDDITAYQRAADAILSRAQNAKASADEPPLVTGRIPLPKSRPLPRP